MSNAALIQAGAHANHPLARHAALLDRAWAIPQIKAVVRELSQSPTFCRHVCPNSDALTMGERDCLAVLLAGLGRLWDAFKVGKTVLTIEQFVGVTGLPPLVAVFLVPNGLVIPAGENGDRIDTLPLLELPWTTTHEESNAYALDNKKKRVRALAAAGVKKERKKYTRTAPVPEHLSRKKSKPAEGPQPGGK